MSDVSTNRKLLGVGLFVWLLSRGSSSGSSKKSTPSAKTTPTKKPAPKVKAEEPGRPDEAKPDPGPPVDLRPDKEERPEKPKKPKADKKEEEKPAKRGAPVSETLQEDAAEFAQGFFKVYTDRGIEPTQAALEALSLYLLAGGSDTKEIAKWQKIAGLPQTGEYDKETSTATAVNLDMAIDGAINTLIQKIVSGENPPVVAAEVLLQYVKEGREIGTVIPREKIAALQMLLGVQPISGFLDEPTKNRMVELGVTPTEEE